VLRRNGSSVVTCTGVDWSTPSPEVAGEGAADEGDDDCDVADNDDDESGCRDSLVTESMVLLLVTSWVFDVIVLCDAESQYKDDDDGVDDDDCDDAGDDDNNDEDNTVCNVVDCIGGDSAGTGVACVEGRDCSVDACGYVDDLDVNTEEEEE